MPLPQLQHDLAVRITFIRIAYWRYDCNVNPCAGFSAGAGLPAVKAIGKITAPCAPSSIQRSHSASSDIVKAALRQHSANVHNSKSGYHCRYTAAARRTLQGCHAIMTP